MSVRLLRGGRPLRCPTQSRETRVVRKVRNRIFSGAAGAPSTGGAVHAGSSGCRKPLAGWLQLQSGPQVHGEQVQFPVLPLCLVISSHPRLWRSVSGRRFLAPRFHDGLAISTMTSVTPNDGTAPPGGGDDADRDDCATRCSTVRTVAPRQVAVPVDVASTTSWWRWRCWSAGPGRRRWRGSG